MEKPTNKTTRRSASGLSDLKQALVSIQKVLSSLEERVYGLIQDLAESDPTVAPSPLLLSPQIDPSLPPSVGGSSPNLDSERDALGPSPFALASELRVSPLTGGAMLVELVDRSKIKLPFALADRSSIRLTPVLAALFQELIADTVASGDSLVGWRSITELKLALEKRVGGGFSRQSVRQLAWRFRRTLELAKVDDRFLQSDRKLGYRFALSAMTFYDLK